MEKGFIYIFILIIFSWVVSTLNLIKLQSALLKNLWQLVVAEAKSPFLA